MESKHSDSLGATNANLPRIFSNVSFILETEKCDADTSKQPQLMTRGKGRNIKAQTQCPSSTVLKKGRWNHACLSPSVICKHFSTGFFLSVSLLISLVVGSAIFVMFNAKDHAAKIDAEYRIKIFSSVNRDSVGSLRQICWKRINPLPGHSNVRIILLCITFATAFLHVDACGGGWVSCGFLNAGCCQVSACCQGKTIRVC
jgi:hypothetical protein